MTNPSNNSNQISIFIAIIAAIFILGGVYLLNQSINSQNATPTAASSRSSLSFVSRSLLNSSVSSSVASLELDASSLSSLSSSSSSVSSSVQSSVSQPQIDEDLISSSSSSISSSVSSLSSNQVQARITSRNGNAYQLEILDSGIVGSKFFKTGAKIKQININGFDLQEGSTYLLTMSVEETDTTFKITSITSAQLL